MADYEVKEDGEEGREKSRWSWCDPKVAAFTLSFGFAAFVTQGVNAYVSSQVTTLEKAFGLTSTQSGFINSANDVGFLTTVIVCSHFARKLHIPRFLAVSTFIYGFSSLLCSLPHFIYGSTDKIDVNGTKTVRSQEMCLPTDSEDYCTSTLALAKQNSNSVAYGIIILGMILQGMAKSGRTPLMTIYIDNNVGSRERTAPYISIVNIITLFGPSSAFGLGGLFAGIYVTLEDTDLTRNDPRWIGAWYLGFLVYGGLALIMGIPLLFFPKNIKRKHGESNELDQENVEMSKTNGHTSLEKSTKRKSLRYMIKDLLASISKLSTNVVYVLMVCATSVIAITTAGPIAFQSKYGENQFNVTPAYANIILAGSIISTTVIGNVIGGIVVAKFKLGLRGCLRFTAFFVTLSAITVGFATLLGCPQPIINGPSDVSDVSYDVACGAGCGCTETDFFPICGADGQNYHSPCFAGCKTQNSTFFGDCECIPGGTARPGLCPFDCENLVPYATVRVVASLFGVMTLAPVIMILIRSVPDNLRAIGLGMWAFFITLLGWLPGPILYGRVIDSACTIWNYSCGQQGSCALYDLYDIRIKFHLMTSGFQLIAVLFMCVGLLHIHRKSSKDVNITSTKK